MGSRSAGALAALHEGLGRLDPAGAGISRGHCCVRLLGLGVPAMHMQRFSSTGGRVLTARSVDP